VSKNDGGPAFGHGDPVHGGDPGMTLRDWFAGQALAGMLASEGSGGLSWGANEDIAQHAYKMADAMLAAGEET